MLQARPKILIADDSPTNRLAVRRIVDEFPCDAVETSTGAEALSALEKEEFALVLMDVQMPEVDGFEAVRRMRRLPSAQATPVIFITAAYTDPAHHRMGYELGAVDYLVNKPVEPDVLRQKVRVFLDLYQQRVELQKLLADMQEQNERLNFENEQHRATRSVLEKRATHDPLTGLPNRTLLADRIDIAMQRAQRGGKGFAIILIDLDNFKEVNDRHGHGAGDTVLTEVAKRLISTVRGSDTVARFAGDEFVVLMEGLDQEMLAPGLGQKIVEALSEPINLLTTTASNLQVRQTASIGISLYPADADDMDGLMVLADVAMYDAKHSGGHAMRVYRQTARRRSQTGKV